MDSTIWSTLTGGGGETAPPITVSLFPSEVLYLEESWGINGASFPLEFEKCSTFPIPTF
jgi:hypothetical protein